jgi:hypothetical protein
LASITKKSIKLGIPFGTASARLRKNVLFSLVKKCNENVCYRCGEKIEDVSELSIEHKIAWENSDDPIKLFYDLDNIAFSHLFCNISFSSKRQVRHGTFYRYKMGCKCEECREAKSIDNRNRYLSKKEGI